MTLKFNEESINTQITAFKDAHDRNPYIICSKKTYELFPECERIEHNGFIHLSYNELHINGSNNTYHIYKDCKVFIDDELEIGEVIFA